MTKRKKIIIGALILTLAVVVGIGATTVLGLRAHGPEVFLPAFIAWDGTLDLTVRTLLISSYGKWIGT